MPQIKCNRCKLPIDRERDAFVTMPNAEQCGFRSRRPTAFAHARCFERDVKAAHDQELASREVIVPHPPAQIEYQHVPIGQWFFVDIPECRDRYNVVERTESGCIAVCSSPWHHDKSKADLIEIVRLHNHATVDPIATKKWVPPMTVHTLHGVKYQACNVGGSTWMVKKLICGNDFENQANYVEALISVDTTDEMTAIQAAFARGSWA